MWPRIIAILVVGYLALSRSFAHLGIPPLKLFIGDIALAAFIWSKPRAVLGRWFETIAQAGPLHGFSLAYLAFFIYGFGEVLRGIALGYRPIMAIQSFVVQIYPLYFFVALWVRERNPDLLPRMIRWLAWFNGVYGVLYIIGLNGMYMLMPGSNDTLLFGQPAGSALAIVGLLAFERDLIKVSHLLLMNFFCMLGVEVRAEFLMLALGVVGWAVLSKNLGRLTGGVSAMVVILAVGFFTDFSIPAPATRGGDISVRYLLGRVISVVDVETASQFAPGAKNHAGTYTWRTEWWKEIWADTHKDAETAMFGEGYGFPLASLVKYINSDNIRTPHSIFYYCLGYMGWMGVALFTLMQAALAQILWKSYLRTGQCFGIVSWGMVCVGSLFGNSFETPFVAIPFYLLCGLAAAVPAAVPVSSRIHETSHRAQLLPAARW